MKVRPLRAAMIVAAIAWTIVRCAFGVSAATGASPAPKPSPHGAPAVNASGGLSTGNFNVETDQTDYDLKTGDFTMPHHVHFTRPGTDVTGDSAKGNSQRGTLVITGNVVLHQNGPLGGVSASSKVAQAPSTLTTDQLAVDSKRKQYVATGAVKFTQSARVVTAQRGVLDEGSHTLDLSGSVHIEDGPQTLDADTVHYDTLTEHVDVHGAPVIIRAPAATPLPASPKPTRAPKRR